MYTYANGFVPSSSWDFGTAEIAGKKTGTGPLKQVQLPVPSQGLRSGVGSCQLVGVNPGSSRGLDAEEIEATRHGISARPATTQDKN